MIKFDREKTTDYMLGGLLLFLGVLFFFNLGHPSVWKPNEAFYAETAREMLESGDFLDPYFNYEPRFQKPPLLYWFVLFFYKLFGVNEFATRLTPALAAIFCIGLTFVIARDIWRSASAAILSALTLASAFDLNTAGRYTSPEILLLAFFTLSMYFFYKWHTAHSGKRLWAVFFYASAGLTTLVKGPIGIIMPLMVIIPFLLIERDFKSLKGLADPLGIFLFLSITVPWYAYMLNHHGDAFFNVLWGENVRRFLTQKSGTSNYFFYLTVIPWNFFPGSLFLIPALIWTWKRKYEMPESRLLLIWAGVIFLFFSLSKSKLPPYIYPIFPAISIMAGGWLHKSALARSGNLIRYLSLAGLLILLVATAMLRTFVPGIGAAWLLVPLFFMGLCSLEFKDLRLYALMLYAGMAAFFVIFMGLLIPSIETLRPYKEIASRVRAAEGDEKARFYYAGIPQENLSFYLERHIEYIPEAELPSVIRKEEAAFFLLDKKTYETEGLRLEEAKVVWSGPYHVPSESRFYRFLTAIRDKGMEEHVVIFKRQ